MITKWIDNDTLEYVITSTYTEGKSYIFNSFFGWRKTREGKAKFVLSKRDWEKIDVMIRYYNRFVKKTE
jgi:hypothetical protein